MLGALIGGLVTLVVGGGAAVAYFATRPDGGGDDKAPPAKCKAGAPGTRVLDGFASDADKRHGVVQKDCSVFAEAGRNFHLTTPVGTVFRTDCPPLNPKDLTSVQLKAPTRPATKVQYKCVDGRAQIQSPETSVWDDIKGWFKPLLGIAGGATGAYLGGAQGAGLGATAGGLLGDLLDGDTSSTGDALNKALGGMGNKKAADLLGELDL